VDVELKPLEPIAEELIRLLRLDADGIRDQVSGGRIKLEKGAASILKMAVMDSARLNGADLQAISEWVCPRHATLVTSETLILLHMPNSLHAAAVLALAIVIGERLGVVIEQ
jgi:hypothetical protein